MSSLLKLKMALLGGEVKSQHAYISVRSRSELRAVVKWAIRRRRGETDQAQSLTSQRPFFRLSKS